MVSPHRCERTRRESKSSRAIHAAAALRPIQALRRHDRRFFLSRAVRRPAQFAQLTERPDRSRAGKTLDLSDLRRTRAGGGQMAKRSTSEVCAIGESAVWAVPRHSAGSCTFRLVIASPAWQAWQSSGNSREMATSLHPPHEHMRVCHWKVHNPSHPWRRTLVQLSQIQGGETEPPQVFRSHAEVRNNQANHCRPSCRLSSARVGRGGQGALWHSRRARPGVFLPRRRRGR